MPHSSCKDQTDGGYDTENSDFDALMKARVDAMAKAGPAGWPTGIGPAKDTGLIDLLASTSKILGYRLSSGAALSDRAKTLAYAKFNALYIVIDRAKTKTAEVKGVVLFNYRIGDVNKQHNANPTILLDVREAVAKKGYVIIVIPQMASGVYRTHKAKIAATGSYVFDLLDVDSGSTEFIDDTAKAYFWHLVASFLQGSNSLLGTPTSLPPTEVATLAATPRPRWLG
ncbi:hypothetical protein VTI74DRAFT_9735 [Chaetomium olivicolor]